MYDFGTLILYACLVKDALKSKNDYLAMVMAEIEERNFDKENDKIVGWIGGVLSFIIFLLFLFNEPWRDRGCFLNEHFIYQEEFTGRVIKKFIDYPNHAAESVRFRGKDDISLLRGKYYPMIEIGDSIHKIQNSFTLEIHKKDTTLIMIYKMSCDE